MPKFSLCLFLMSAYFHLVFPSLPRAAPYPHLVRRKAQPSQAVVVNVARRAVHEQNNCESVATNVVLAARKVVNNPRNVVRISLNPDKVEKFIYEFLKNHIRIFENSYMNYSTPTIICKFSSTFRAVLTRKTQTRTIKNASAWGGGRMMWSIDAAMSAFELQERIVAATIILCA